MKITDPDVHVIAKNAANSLCICRRFVDVLGAYEYALLCRCPAFSLVDKLLRWLLYYKSDRWLYHHPNPEPYRWKRVCQTYQHRLTVAWREHYQMDDPPGKPPPPARPARRTDTDGGSEVLPQAGPETKDLWGELADVMTRLKTAETGRLP